MTDDEITQTDIAIDQLEYLREHPGACAWVSIRAGCHPYVRWNGETYEIAERVGYGEIEVQRINREGLVSIFSNNSVDIKPCSEADAAGENIWDRVEENGEEVTVFE